MSACPDPQVWLDYAAARLDATENAKLAAHLDGCEACLVLAGDALHEHRVASTRDEAPGRRQRPVLPVLPQRIDRYVVLELLGSGGMGEVLLAYDPSLDRRVAIKLAQRRRGDDTRGLEARLETEAQALARAADRHVVGVYDTGRFEGRQYVAMEYVRGNTLKTWLATTRSRAEVLRVFTEAAHGLAAAHRVGVVHRDFKPDNVLLDDTGHARVTDFGLATLHERVDDEAPLDRSEDDTQQVHTRTGAVLGTPGYMSPEQWDAATTDARTDQFSFCIALHEALLGERPFLKPSIRGARPTFERTPESLRRLKDQPTELRTLLTRGLAAKPEERFASMDDLLAALRRAQRPSRAPWFAAAAVVLVCAVGGLAYASRSPCHGALDRIRAPRLEASGLDARATSIAEALETRWAATWEQSCAETNERREQPPEVLALRSECLSRHEQRYRQVVAQFPKNEAGALEALELSPRPEDCLAVEPLLSVDAPTTAQKPEVSTLRGAVLAARVAVDLGEYADAHEKLSALEAAVKKVGFRRLDAEFTYAGALLAMRERDWRGARGQYHQALTSALVARDFELAALSAIELLLMSSTLGLVEEAQLVDALADGLVKRLDSRNLEGKLENVRGAVAIDRSRLDDADAHFARALALREAVFGRRHLEVANVLGNQGLIARRRGDLTRAEALQREELEMLESLLGPRHPLVARTLESLADVLQEAGQRDAALALVTRSLEIRQQVLGPTHRLTLRSQQLLAEYELKANNFDGARQRLLALLAAWEPSSLDAANIASRLAELERLAGRYELALKWSRTAQATFTSQLSERDDEVLWEREQEAEILFEQGDAAAAQALLRPLEAEWRTREDAADRLADVLVARARVSLRQRDGTAALRLLDEARELSLPLGAPAAVLSAIELVKAQALLSLGRRADALRVATTARQSLEGIRAPTEIAALDSFIADTSGAAVGVQNR